MNKITRKKPNYMKLFLISYIWKENRVLKSMGYKEVKVYGIKCLRKKRLI